MHGCGAKFDQEHHDADVANEPETGETELCSILMDGLMGGEFGIILCHKQSFNWFFPEVGQEWVLRAHL